MAPLGLVILKLGIQAAASNDIVTGSTCLKVSVPRENDSRQSQSSRYGLFSGKPPKLTSQPTLLPLPFPSDISSSSQHHRLSSSLLALDPSHTSYPPSPAHGGGADHGPRPYLDVSSTTGQVFIVLDWTRRTPAGSGSGTRRDAGSSTGRREWVVIMEFEMGIERSIENAFKVSIPLPKCLDNVIRFQINSPHASSSSTPDGEVTISTEPKLLPLPPHTFASADQRGNSKHEDESDDEDQGSWLEGRFQSTDALRLEWSFGTGETALSTLTVNPIWNPRQPSIQVQYRKTTLVEGLSIPVEAILPDGWGWSNLSIYGEGLRQWRSLDTDAWNAVSPSQIESPQIEEDEGPDDSFQTIRGKRNGAGHPRLHQQSRSSPSLHFSSSVSLLRQTLPSHMDMNMEDFSLEMNSMDDLPPPTPHPVRPVKPLSRPLMSTPSPPQQQQQVVPSIPIAARSFDLDFEGSGEKSWVLEGTLVPLSGLTLVSPGISVRIPFIRVDEGDPSCDVTCPGKTTNAEQPINSDGSICDLTPTTIGSFNWTDERGEILSPALTVPLAFLKGEVKVRLTRSTWGVVTMLILFPWPRRAQQVRFTIPHSSAIRLTRVTKGGVPIPRATVEKADATSVYLGLGDRVGNVEVVLELEGEEEIKLPRFTGEGVMKVELKGQGWDGVTSNMTLKKAGSYTHDLSSPATITFGSDTTRRASEKPSGSRIRTLLSWNSFFNLFMLWLLVSMAQQVQRLRNEVAFVAEEARDLRLYGIGTTSIPTSATATPPSPFSAATNSANLDFDRYVAPSAGQGGRGEIVMRQDGDGVSTALGRVVFGRTFWEQWTNHPTVRTLRRSIGWVWQAVIWLVVPG